MLIDDLRLGRSAQNGVHAGLPSSPFPAAGSAVACAWIIASVPVPIAVLMRAMVVRPLDWGPRAWAQELTTLHLVVICSRIGTREAAVLRPRGAYRFAASTVHWHQ